MQTQTSRIAKLMVQRAKRKAHHAKGSNPLYNWWRVNTQFIIPPYTR